MNYRAAKFIERIGCLIVLFSIFLLLIDFFSSLDFSRSCMNNQTREFISNILHLAFFYPLPFLSLTCSPFFCFDPRSLFYLPPKSSLLISFSLFHFLFHFHLLCTFFLSLSQFRLLFPNPLSRLIICKYNFNFYLI